MTNASRLPIRAWRKSSYSNQNGGNCLEVADGVANAVPVRDSKVPDGPALLVPADAWTAFVTGVKDGGLTGEGRTRSR